MKNGALLMEVVFGRPASGANAGKAVQASRRHSAAVFTEVDPAERKRTMRLVEEYCGVDTMAIVELAWRLSKLA